MTHGELEKGMAEALHALGNNLNRITLQGALLERKIPAELQADVKIIREECRQAGGVLARLRQLREELRNEGTNPDGQ